MGRPPAPAGPGGRGAACSRPPDVLSGAPGPLRGLGAAKPWSRRATWSLGPQGSCASVVTGCTCSRPEELSRAPPGACAASGPRSARASFGVMSFTPDHAVLTPLGPLRARGLDVCVVSPPDALSGVPRPLRGLGAAKPWSRPVAWFLPPTRSSVSVVSGATCSRPEESSPPPPGPSGASGSGVKWSRPVACSRPPPGPCGATGSGAACSRPLAWSRASPGPCGALGPLRR